MPGTYQQSNISIFKDFSASLLPVCKTDPSADKEHKTYQHFLCEIQRFFLSGDRKRPALSQIAFLDLLRRCMRGCLLLLHIFPLFVSLSRLLYFFFWSKHLEICLPKKLVSRGLQIRSPETTVGGKIYVCKNPTKPRFFLQETTAELRH